MVELGEKQSLGSTPKPPAYLRAGPFEPKSLNPLPQHDLRAHFFTHQLASWHTTDVLRPNSSDTPPPQLTKHLIKARGFDNWFRIFAESAASSCNTPHRLVPVILNGYPWCPS